MGVTYLVSVRYHASLWPRCRLLLIPCAVPSAHGTLRHISFITYGQAREALQSFLSGSWACLGQVMFNELDFAREVHFLYLAFHPWITYGTVHSVARNNITNMIP